MKYYILNSEGFYLGLQLDNPDGYEFYTTVPPIGNFIKFKFDGENWIEGITPEELAELEKLHIPQVITRRQFKIALAVLGKDEQSILNGIAQLPEPNQTIARISYMEAGTFERNNPELITVATNFLQMNSQQIDQVFIIGSQY